MYEKPKLLKANFNFMIAKFFSLKNILVFRTLPYIRTHLILVLSKFFNQYLREVNNIY